ncbi:Bifunctional cytochrome NADPH reductase [Penicillium lividum]|nr:Bifunctional cytochrome NADPH reductase [Penicillium lividum]
MIVGRWFEQGYDEVVEEGSVRDVCKEILVEKRREKIARAKEAVEELSTNTELDDDAAADKFFDGLRGKERYATFFFT